VDVADVGEFQASCVARKDALVKFSQVGSGRVQLDAFSKWSQGKESVELLQHSGAASGERLLIANYMVQPSSCNSSGTYHALCCVSSCLPILGKLEEKVQSPVASPGRLLRLVTDMSGLSTPVQASKQLAQELHLIAERHGGDVPLHSEAFAQWLHRAFPNECPSPAFLRHASTAGSFDVTAWLRSFDVRAFLPDVDLKDVGRVCVRCHYLHNASHRPLSSGRGFEQIQWSRRRRQEASQKGRVRLQLQLQVRNVQMHHSYYRFPDLFPSA